MTSNLEEQQITDAFADQAGALDLDEAPFSSIAARVHQRRRRRVGLRSAAALVAVSGITYGSVRLFSPTPDRLAVTASTTGVATSPSAPTTASTTPKSESTPADSTLNNMVTSVPEAPVSPDVDPSQTVSNLTLGRGAPVAYRDGFLLSMAEVPDDDSSGEPSRLSFVFTPDGKSLQTVGELTVQGQWSRPAVDGDTVAIAALTDGDHPELHLYRSDDLTTWSEDIIDLADQGPIAELTPAMRQLLEVDVSLMGRGGQLVTNGDDWVLSVYLNLAPTTDLWRDFNIDRDAGIGFSASGLHFSIGDTESTIPAAELGLTEADLASYERVNVNGGDLFVAGHWGQSSIVIAGDDASAGADVFRFGDGFGVLDPDGRILVSDDGRSWTELASDLPAAQMVVALTGLDGDLLALTSDGERVEAHRVGADGATTLLSEAPLRPNLVFDTGVESPPGPGIVIAVPDPFEPVPVGDITLNTADYEITMLDVNTSQEIDPKVHYVVRDKATGDVVAENTRPFGDWQSGEAIDGIAMVVFTDSEGRDDVRIPLSEFEAAIEHWYAELAAATPDSTASESSRDYVELATADGIKWYQNPDPDEWTIAAVNEGQVMLIRREYVADWFEVIDLEGGAGEG